MSDTPPPSRPDPHRPPSSVAQENIRAVAALERDAARQRSRSERVSDALIRVMGTLGFVIAHVVLFAGWCVVNVGMVPGIRPFDPFPFGILTLIVSTEGVLLAIFVLVNQNRMSREADHRAHLDLQVSLLAEAEATKILAVLQDLSRKLGHDPRIGDAELERLAEPTNLPELSRDLREKLEDEDTKES